MDDPVLLDDLRSSKLPPASVYDDMFESYFNRATETSEPSPKASSSSSTPPPVFDKPVFDDEPDTVDPFDAIPLFGGGSGGGDAEEDFLGGLGTTEDSEGRREPAAAGFVDDLFPGLCGSTRSTEPVRGAVLPNQDQEAVDFDELISGFGRSVKPALPVEAEVVVLGDGVIPTTLGRSTQHHNSARDDPVTRQESGPMLSSKMSVGIPEDSFDVLSAAPTSEYSSVGLFSDYLDNIGMPEKSENTNINAPTNTCGRFQGSDMFAGFTKAMPSVSFASDKECDITERRSVDSMSQSNHVLHGKPDHLESAEATAGLFPEMNISEPSVINEVPRTLNPFDVDDGVPENKDSKIPNDAWLTVSDITLVTQPTSAPPPSRPPPPLATRQLPTESVTTRTYSYNHIQGSVRSADAPKSSQIDELEDFFTAKPAKFANGHTWVLNHEGTEQHASAGTATFKDEDYSGDSKGMKQSFMDQADFGSVFTWSQCRLEQKDENLEFYAYELEKKTDQDEKSENERRQRKHDVEQRRAEREREEELERETEKVRQSEQQEKKKHEKEREVRQAVAKAIQEARERAGAEARVRAESEARRRAERAAVQKVAAEARERAAAEARERAAKTVAEAKERAAAETKERAEEDARERAAREKAAAESQEKAAAEAWAKAERAAVEKAAAEARRRAERAVFEKVAAEVRERAANEARQRAAAEAWTRENQQRTQPDLESLFGMPSRSSSAPKSQTSTTNPFDVNSQGSSGSSTGTVGRTSSGSASPFVQPSSSNPTDDLSSIFGAPSSSVFQQLNGESEERRKARLERHQRTMERAIKALADKNERDLQAQREQEERHRIGEVLDFEIKRWAAGKEGNIRALLSTLQYVLWPECGWRPVSLTDLVTAASVKKEYRKATLCIHPDKVQQKGANLQQKYIAEKVFDLLKGAWNKFNSEELF